MISTKKDHGIPRTFRRSVYWLTLWGLIVTLSAAACGYYFAHGSAIRAVLIGFAGALISNVPMVLWRPWRRGHFSH